MTDKVQKIREEVERLKGWNNNVRNSTRHMTLQEEDFNRGKHSSYLEILNFIDSLQGEPVSKDYRERYKNIAQSDAFKSAYKNKSLGEVMPVEGKEPVSDDLQEAADNALESIIEQYDILDVGDCLEMFKLGAKWQENQFEKNRLKHCNSITNKQAELEQGFIDQHLDKHKRMPTYLDAIEHGMKWQKEQMMAKAVDAEVHIDAGGYPYIPQIELYDYYKDKPLANEGDKYKVVLIKEE